MFLCGMKIINNYDRALGIGTVTKVDSEAGHISVKFPVDKTERTYAIGASGIRRIIVRPVDQCECQNGETRIKVHLREGNQEHHPV